MKVLSVRIPDEDYRQVERVRLEAGQSRTQWLRSLVEAGIANAGRARPPEPAAVQFCLHPEAKRLGSFCVACGADVPPGPVNNC